MKRTALVLNPVLAAVLLGACSTTPKAPDSAWKIAPTQSVRHGAPVAASHYALGRHQESRGAIDDAIASYRRAVEAEPTQLAAWSALGALLARNGQLAEGLAALERAVSLAPSASHTHNNLGYALLLAGRDADAVVALQKAVDLDAGNRRAFGNLATAYRRLGQLEKASQAAAQAGPGTDTQLGVAVAPAAADTHAVSTIAIDTGAPSPERPPALGGMPALAKDNAAARTSVGLIRPASAQRIATPMVAPRAGAFLTPVAAGTPRLVKVADNLYRLRIGPADAATTIDQAGAIVARAVTAEPDARSASVASRSSPASATAPRPDPMAATAPPTAPTRIGGAGSLPDPIAAGAQGGASTRAPARYEIANGHGGSGLARRVAELLASPGTPQPRLTNQRPFDQAVSYVEYREGFQDVAQVFASRLPFQPRMRNTPSSTITVDVRLVLGHDLTTSNACDALGVCNRVAEGAATALVLADTSSTGQP